MEKFAIKRGWLGDNGLTLLSINKELIGMQWGEIRQDWTYYKKLFPFVLLIFGIALPLQTNLKDKELYYNKCGKYEQS